MWEELEVKQNMVGGLRNLNDTTLDIFVILTVNGSI